MSAAPVCPNCRVALPNDALNRPEPEPCLACSVPIQFEIFPAYFRKAVQGQSGEAVMIEGESSCFYHPQKKAAVPCSACGRFLCALCDCEFAGEHFCPGCLETGKSKGKIKALENQRTRYDNIAMALALCPLLIFYFTLITAPMTLFVAIRYWKSPRSLVRPGSFRFILAITIAVLEIVGWTALFIGIATAR
jgi:hypothetical protein